MSSVSSRLYATALALSAVSLLGTACGDPLVDGRYRGEPLFTMSGTVIADESFAEEMVDFDTSDLHISIEWSEWEGENERGGYDLEEVETLTSFPAQFEMRIYQPPPLEALFETDWLPGHEIAVGRPLLYLDDDGDRRWDTDEDEVLGGAIDTVLVYVEPDWDDETDEAEWGEEVDERWDDDIWEDGPYGELGLELHYGYQRMYDIGELCELDPEDWEDEDWDDWEEMEDDDEWDAEDWFPDEDEPVMLFVGEGVEEELYFDWECDGDDY